MNAVIDKITTHWSSYLTAPLGERNTLEEMLQNTEVQKNMLSEKLCNLNDEKAKVESSIDSLKKEKERIEMERR